MKNIFCSTISNEAEGDPKMFFSFTYKLRGSNALNTLVAS